MRLQKAVDGEGTVTLTALERLLLVVSTKVHLEVAAASKTSLTQVTPVWFFSGVDAVVDGQVSLGVEC